MTERKARRIVYARSNGVCEQCGRQRATDYQHRVNRSQGGKWSPSNALHLCHPCHMWIHANPNDANTFGLYLRSWQNPAAEPALVRGRWVLLTDDGSTEVTA